MFSTTSLLPFVTLALFIGSQVTASPVIRVENTLVTLPIASKFNMNVTHVKLADADRSRAKALKTTSKTQGSKKLADSGEKNGSDKRQQSIKATDATVIYTASVGVGSPATPYTLLIDTGSSNTWVGAQKAFIQTSSTTGTGNTVTVSYGSGFMTGDEFIDTVTLADGLVVNKQSIGVATEATGFNGVDGILGVGPRDLTEGTLGNTADSIPTVVDNLLAQGTIPEAALGVFYVPSAETDTAGELTFGGPDATKTTSEVTFVPVTSQSPASGFWGIDQSISYGSTTILSSTAGIVDTGTTLILIATDAFQAYQTATGAQLDPTTGLLTISSAQYENLQNLDFTVGSNTFSLTPNAQIWPRSLNSVLGGDTSSIYLVVADLGSPSGEGLDFINGYSFLQRFYSVYDTTNNQVGFAPTQFTNSTSN